MDALIQMFSESLAIPGDWQRKASATFQRILLLFQKRSEYSLDRFRIVGGVAKKTSTCLKADVDVCVYYNDDVGREPVLNDLEDILLMNTDLKTSDVRKTEYLLSFTYEEIPFDVVVVKNLVIGSRENVEQLQLELELREVKKYKDPKVAQKELTLSIQSVEWMKEKSKLCHDIARLAKYWSQTLLYDKKADGKSYIIELLAVKSAIQVENTAGSHPGGLYAAAFRQFLEYVKNLREVKICFDTNSFDDSQISREIMRKVPLLLNPVNPHQNLLDDIPDDFFDIFGSCARESLSRLQKFRQSYQEESALSVLFMPQPKLYDLKDKVFLPTEIILGTENKKLSLPKIMVNRENKKNQSREDMNKMQMFIHCLLHNFAAVLQAKFWPLTKPSSTFQVAVSPSTTSRNTHGREPTLAEMMDFLKYLIAEMFKTHGPWGPSCDAHESRFCTLFFKKDDNSAVKVSFNLIEFNGKN